MGLIKDVQQNEVSEQRRMPVDGVASDAIKTVSGETVQLYYYNAGTLTQDAGQAAGTVVVGKLANRNIKNALGDVVGCYNDTSVSFTSTALTTLVEFPYSTAELNDMNTGTLKAQAVTNGLANGEYCIDHRTGTIYGVKDDATTTLTSTSYKVELAVSGGGGGIASDVNIESVNGMDAPEDETAMPALPKFLPIGGEYRAAATTYTDGDATVLQTNVAGWLKISGNGEHDQAILNEGVETLMEAINFDGTAAPNPASSEGNAVRPVSSLSGVQMVMLTNDDGSDYGQIKGYDTGTDSLKVFDVAPVSETHVEETLADVTNGTDGTYYYYMDMDGYRNFAVQMTLNGGSGTATVTCEATIQDDGTAAASCTYVDVTSSLFGVASTTSSDIWSADTPVAFKYVRLKVVASTGAADDADWTIYSKKLY